METVNCLCSCMQHFVKREDISYVFRTKEKIDDLKNAMEQLTAKKEDLQRKLDDPQHNRKVLDNQHQLQHWLRDVEDKHKKVEQLLDEYGEGNCVAGSCSLNCLSRYKISRNAFKLRGEINQLKAEQPEIKFTDIPPPKPVPESSKIVGKKIRSNVDVARSYLADERVGIIGIWGMGGVGKTTLLKKIRHSLSDDANMGFNHVLFIEASKGIQVKELREQIAERLNLKSSAGKEDIFNVLKISNFVLLLDNIWEEVDLVDLGIINPYDDSTNQYKHKVIFTTRSEGVCARMEASKKIKVECLEEDEAWALFKHNVNLAVIESDAKFNKIAREVMNKCGGLPLALKVVGKAMSNKKSVQDWEFILNSIKNSGTSKVQGVEESLFPILKFSYDNLTHDFKECFLSFCMLREQSKHEIVWFWMGFGLISDFDNLQEAYGKGETILKTLEESCLLSDDGDDDYVSLHDVIYEMAVWIASNRGMSMNKWIVKKYDGLAAEIPTHDAENWRFANQMIIEGKVEFLPKLSHQCSDLLCLMIQFNSCFKKIHEGFFRQMPNLTYLNLQHTFNKELPKDIKCLVNLQYLNISSTHISSLPKELVYLQKLQYLLCRDTKLSKVEDGLMSRLQKLKVIDIFPSGWVEPEQLKKLKNHNNIKAIGIRVVSEEVHRQLSCLPTAWLCLYNLDIISLSFDTLSCKDHGFLQEIKIKSCPQLEKIVMNGRETHLNELKISDVEKLSSIIWTDLSPPEFFHVLKKLHISNCNMDNLAWVLHLPCLSWLSIKDCAEIETLFYIKEGEIQQQEVSEHRPTLPSLQVLELFDLPKLVSISNFALDFPQLTTLVVNLCLNLKKLPFKSGISNNQGMIDFIGDREWWESLEWDDATIPSHLHTPW